MAVLQVTTAHYPESDGKPLGETDKHIRAIHRHYELLRRYFAGQDVYVSENLLLYYEPGDQKKFVVPDTFVVKGRKQYDRRVYKTWVERKAPDVVIEVTSRKTRKIDLTVKPALYERLGVKEYFIFDPDEEFLDPPLQGYRLSNLGYERIVPDENGFLISEELGLRLHVQDERVECYRLDTGERLLSQAEGEAAAEARAETEAQARAAAEVRAAAESVARQAADAEVAKLREELARLTSHR